MDFDRLRFLFFVAFFSIPLVASTIGAAEDFDLRKDVNITYVSTLDGLSMRMDVAYDGAKTDLPVILVLHGYNSLFDDVVLERLARKGLFAVKTYKRGFGSSQGSSDDSGREIHDFYDAVEHVKTHYSSRVDPGNINVVGYSGGGGNAYGLLTKFPDYFSSASIFFGMSDYGFNDTFGWWNNGGGSYQSMMVERIGGTPEEVLAKYMARAHYLGAKNNPYTHIQLFYDVDESVAPLTHATQYASVGAAAGFTNTVMRASNSSSITSELADDYSTGLGGYSSLGRGDEFFRWDSAGYINWSTDRNATFSALYKKFDSLRDYSRADHFKARFVFSLTSSSANGAVIFGFRNSADTALKNSASVIIVDNRPYLRIDYNGTPLSSENRDLAAFASNLSLDTSYVFVLEVDESVLAGSLMNSEGGLIEAKELGFNPSKCFGEVDSFGLYAYNGPAGQDSMSGVFDDLAVDAYARWIHGYPVEGAGAAEGCITAENYFVKQIAEGQWSGPQLQSTGSMFIPGYLKTRKFWLMLGNGDDEAAELVYNISGSADSRENAVSFTLDCLTGDAALSLQLYDLKPETLYLLYDDDLSYGMNSIAQAVSSQEGILSFTRTLAGRHRYAIFAPTTSTTSTTTTTTTSTTTTPTSTTLPECVMPGNSPPCDEVSLFEVVSAINLWAAGDFNLIDVVDLISSWSNPGAYPPA